MNKLGQAFVKVFNFVQREFAYTGQVDLVGKFMPYGPDNAFPNRLADLVDGSPTATSCLSTLTDFIAGEGLNEGDDLENMVVNKQGLKFFQYHSICSDSFSHYWGVATIVKFNKMGQITELYPVPFQYCRLGKPDDQGIISKIHYNPYFGTALYKAQDTEVYDTWSPEVAISQIARDEKFKGQIFWMGIQDRKHPFYPIPDYYSANRWMNLEKNAAIYYDENLENGFLQSAIMGIIGNPNDSSGKKDSNGEDIPKGELLNKEMSENFTGAKRNAKIMTFWGDSKEEWPEIKAFPSNASADLYRVQDDHATKKITIATKVPAILANISEGVSLGGDGNTIRAAVKLMQQRVKRPQAILLDYYGQLLSKMVNPITEPINIVAYNPFPELESVDPQVWEVLTPEERRKWVKDHTEIELEDQDVAGETIQEDATQAGPANLFFNSYPKGARENVKRALEWNDKMNGCLKTAGKKVSQQIVDGVPLAIKDIRRLSKFLSTNTVHKNKPYNEACEALQYDAWGGSEMMTWANEKIRELSGKID